MAKSSSLPLPFSLGDALAEEAKALAKGSSLLLAGTGGVLVEELLVVVSLFMVGASGVLFEELLAAGSLPVPWRVRVTPCTCPPTVQSLRMGAKEPVVIHRYSFAEEEGRGGGPLLLVPT